METQIMERPRPVSAAFARPHAVVCTDVVKEFGSGDDKVRALRVVSVEVHAGELALLVGGSGCGKTSLISVIAGLLQPTRGDVTVWGTPLNRLPPRRQVEFRRQNIGFVFQQYNLLPALTAA